MRSCRHPRHDRNSGIERAFSSPCQHVVGGGVKSHEGDLPAVALQGDEGLGLRLLKAILRDAPDLHGRVLRATGNQLRRAGSSTSSRRSNQRNGNTSHPIEHVPTPNRPEPRTGITSIHSIRSTPFPCEKVASDRKQPHAVANRGETRRTKNTNKQKAVR